VAKLRRSTWKVKGAESSGNRRQQLKDESAPTSPHIPLLRTESAVAPVRAPSETNSVDAHPQQGLTTITTANNEMQMLGVIVAFEQLNPG